MEPINGILTRIPGDWVSRATQDLPKVDVLSTPGETAETVLEVPRIGRVRFFCVVSKLKIHRNWLVRWRVIRAELEP